MGLALHELHEVSGLATGDSPYEEYVPTTEELNLMKKGSPQVYRLIGRCYVTFTFAVR